MLQEGDRHTSFLVTTVLPEFLHSMQVCGGGPSLSVWHLRSMACTSVLRTASTQQAALFHDDIVSYRC